MSGPKPEVELHEIAYIHYILVIHIILLLKRNSVIIMQMIMELDKFYILT